ncbi:MAG: glutaredoxin domain-containing protein [Gammaproteobacteria bacterium]|jgi:glutaredoxin|tara:strand:+ start:1411 stop:1635 length:225 start_codon:yes stop_codon:yes gene_type:complete
MIEIWSKPNCPFCDKAENLCIQRELEFKKYMLDVDYSREELFEKFPSARTFPQITIDGNLVGGYTEFAAKILED